MLKRKILVVIIINIICLNLALNINLVYSVDAQNSTTSSNSTEIKINSKVAVAYDRLSGRVIYGKNENKKTAMASTTKIMTAIVALENSNLTDVVEVSQKSAGTGGSRLGLRKDDKITMNDLLYGLMLVSGNDAAVAIAEHVGGSVEGFAQMMNDKANELGLQQTHFVTPHGLDDPEHYTTALELAKMADYALRNETFAKIVKTTSCTIAINNRPQNIHNTNELLGHLDGVYGVKTGFTNNAGRCLVTAINRNGFDIITVIIQADTKNIRTSDSINLIKDIYEDYELVNIEEIVNEQFKEWCLVNEKRISIEKAKDYNKLGLYMTKLEYTKIPIKKSEKDKINMEVNCIYEFKAPLEENTTIGTIRVIIDGENVCNAQIKNSKKIEKRNILDYFCIFLPSMIYYKY